MARTFATIDIQDALAKMLSSIEQIKSDPKLASDYKAAQMAEIRRAGNQAARAALEAKLAQIELEQKEARSKVVTELQRAEQGINWSRASFLHQQFVTMAQSGAEWDQLSASIAMAAGSHDIDALRAWASALPAVRAAKQVSGDYVSEFPQLTLQLRAALEQAEPESVRLARAAEAEIDAAASQFMAEVSILSRKAAPLDEREFLEPEPGLIFGDGSSTSGAGGTMSFQAAGSSVFG